MNTSKLFKSTFLAFLLISNCLILVAQDTVKVIDQSKKIFVVTKNDGAEYTGIIISQDDREVLIETKEIGRLYIPKYEIKSIRELSAGDVKSGTLPGKNIFASRYFLTTNGMRMQKGDSYTLFSWWGPEIQFSVADGLTLGAMTSWVAMPLVLSVKTSFSANENLHFGFGLLAGSLSWINWKSVGALPYAVFTLGNSKNNINLSGGYVMISSPDFSESAPLLSIACHLKITDKVSFVGDSFIYMKKGSFAVIVPGIRVSRNPDKAFQIGLGAFSGGGETVPIAIPILSWFRRL